MPLFVLALVHLAPTNRRCVKHLKASPDTVVTSAIQCCSHTQHTHLRLVHKASIKDAAAFNVLIKSHNSQSAQSAELLICHSSQQVHVQGVSQLKLA